VRLDLGGIAKGYAADRALSELSAAGTPRALVAGGGDLAVGDPPPDTDGWEVALTSLPGTDPPRPLVLARAGISTSGDTEQWLDAGGTRHSHIIDPRTGLALTERRLVSVIASDATTSDMLATAVSVMGPRDGLRLIEEMPGTAALIGTSRDEAVRWVKSGNWP
jgi:thiamine biosynthesis lipoprotein